MIRKIYYYAFTATAILLSEPIIDHSIFLKVKKSYSKQPGYRVLRRKRNSRLKIQSTRDSSSQHSNSDLKLYALAMNEIKKKEKTPLAVKT